MNDIQLTRLPGYDINGNPRYVCHYTLLLTEAEANDNTNIWTVYQGMTRGYHIAVDRAHKIGGRKYHTKSYGGGIVFQGYESNIKADIKRLLTEAEQEQAS